MITSNLRLAAFLLFDTILGCGEVVRWFRFRVLTLPDKPQRLPQRRITRGCTGVAGRVESEIKVTGGNPVNMNVIWLGNAIL